MASGNMHKKTIVLTVLIIVAVGLVAVLYLWQKGRLKTGADIERQQALDEAQEFIAGDDETAWSGSEWKVGDNRVAYRSGTLVRLENTPEIYLIYRGTKRQIENPQVFADLKLKWENVIVHPANDSIYFNKYETGPKIGQANQVNFPNGLTVKFDDSSAVYMVAQDKLKMYPTPSVYFSRHYMVNGGSPWSEISEFPASMRRMTLDLIPWRYRGGELVKSSDDPTVYWVSNAIRYPVDSPKEMERWGFVRNGSIAWDLVITAEPGILSADNPVEKGKKMYERGRKTSEFTNNYLPTYLWKNTDKAMVYVFKYNPEKVDLEFINPQVFLNRFSWSELPSTHPNVRGGGSSTPTPSTSVSILPSGLVACGNNHSTDWKERTLSDYAKTTYPNGLTKMYELIRADGETNAKGSQMQVIFNIQNMTNVGSSQFVAGDKIQIVADLYLIQGINGANATTNNGQYHFYLKKTADNRTINDWLLDDNEMPSKMTQGNHYQVYIHNKTYTLPTNIDYSQASFGESYHYSAHDNTCFWPEKDTILNVFDRLNGEVSI